MKANDVRSTFLKFFERQGHTRVDSSSLIPQNDPTLLFTNAGMVPFKDVFLGKEKRSYSRATSSQKCVRAGGKHNDLENVGFTARHHTFFEMLGNFSFGDYFKKDAIHFAWQFTTKELKLDTSRLYVSVYKDDDEAADLWRKQEGVPSDRIYRFGEKDNFWSMGDTGPCGPCSELFYDRGEKYGCGKSTCAVGCDCDRYMEFWNLVFMQFDRAADGSMKPLPKPSVDTGAGLERLASILQDVDSNYETDLFQDIIGKTRGLLGSSIPQDSQTQTALRVIADHSRATAFLISDGVTPSNEGRGYVLRRIMRRAIRYGKKLGFDKPFLNTTSLFVIEQMAGAYPDLKRQQSSIQRTILTEEELFLRTLERGLGLFDEATVSLKKGATLPGEVAFKLYDTFGFPVDLTRVMAEERGFHVDEAGFDKHMAVQRETSRKHWKGSGDTSTEAAMLQWADELRSKNLLPVFVGYDTLSEISECTGVKPESEGETLATFKRTPFYGESGGQVGDHGMVLGTGTKPFKAQVMDTLKPTPDLIAVKLKILEGTLVVGQSYRQETHAERRALTARNHTATHLLQWALQSVLGTHVKQAGSLVTPDLLRFDFSHSQAMTSDELKKVEDLLNEKIWSGDAVQKKEMAKEQALAAGAIAFFGEKYGERVRVVSVGDYSVELCGGTHVDRSSDIHLFKIVSESGIAAGVRRIIAKTSRGAFEFLRESEERLRAVRDQLQASSVDEISSKLEKLTTAEKDLRKQIARFQSQNAGAEAQSLATNLVRKGKGSYLVAECADAPEAMKNLRELADRVRTQTPDAVVVLVGFDNDSQKVALVVAVGSKQSAVAANTLLQTLAPMIQGKGGGKADFAQAGGSDRSGISALLEKAKQTLETTL